MADPFEHVRKNASKLRERLRFDSRLLPQAENEYVAWLDIMGAGHVMSVSVAKTANFLARLHMTVQDAAGRAPAPIRLNPINDGVFITTSSKPAVMFVLRETLSLLSAYFISTGAPQDRFLLRGSIAFGPVYHGAMLAHGYSGARRAKFGTYLDSVEFGAPIIQAARSEALAPPYGIYVHESARAFAPIGESPFRQTHWLWWTRLTEIPDPVGIVGLPDLASCLSLDLDDHFKWMKSTAIFQGLEPAKIDIWKRLSHEYFSVG